MSFKPERQGLRYLGYMTTSPEQMVYSFPIFSAKMHRLSLVRCILYNIHFVPKHDIATGITSYHLDEIHGHLPFSTMYYLCGNVCHFPILIPNLAFQQIQIAVH